MAADGVTVTELRPAAQSAPTTAPSTTAPSTTAPTSTTAPNPGGTVYSHTESDITPFTMVGVSWLGSQDVRVEYRLQQGGVWTEWHILEIDMPKGSQTVGTDTPYVGVSTGIDVRMISAPGADVRQVRLTLVDSRKMTPASTTPAGSSPLPPPPPANQAGPVASSTGGMTWAQPPAFKTRAQWGANEAYWGAPSIAYCSDWLMFDGYDGAVVHHTAGSNDYALGDVPGILNGILYYHSQTRQWCDIGYHFLFDKWGNVYEGHRDSATAFPIGAHAGPGNWNTIGVSFMGNTDQLTWIDPAVVENMGKIIAWKLTWSGTPVDGWTSYEGIPQVERIAGHRQVMSTSCPGAALWSQMDNIRAAAKRAVEYHPISFVSPDVVIVGRSMTVTGQLPWYMANREVGVYEIGPDGNHWAHMVTTDGNARFTATWTSGYPSGSGAVYISFTAIWSQQWFSPGVPFQLSKVGGAVTTAPTKARLDQRFTLAGTSDGIPAGGLVQVRAITPTGNTYLFPSIAVDASGAWSLSTTWPLAMEPTLTFQVAVPNGPAPGGGKTVSLDATMAVEALTLNDRTTPATVKGSVIGDKGGTLVVLQILGGPDDGKEFCRATTTSTGSFTCSSTYTRLTTNTRNETVYLRGMIGGVERTNRVMYMRQLTSIPTMTPAPAPSPTPGR